MALRKLLLILSVLIGFNSFGQYPMSRLIPKKASDCSYLLDQYSTAEAAYSLRKLRCAYGGSAVRIRRSSDNAEQDIGFSGQNFDDAAFTSFVGAGNGYVVTWYDQSGNARDISNAVTTTQPELLLSQFGSLPAIYFTTDSLGRAAMFSGATAATVFIVSKIDADPPTCFQCGAIIDVQNGTAVPHYPYSDGTIYDAFASTTRHTTGNPTPSLANLHLYCAISAASDWRNYVNNTSLFSTGTNTFGATTRVYLGVSQMNTAYTYLGKIAEVILYASALSDGNRDGVSGNINSFYTIY